MISVTGHLGQLLINQPSIEIYKNKALIRERIRSVITQKKTGKSSHPKSVTGIGGQFSGQLLIDIFSFADTEQIGLLKCLKSANIIKKRLTTL